MSYFVFGQIRYSGGLTESECESSSWHAIKVGHDLSLYVTLACNIVQEVVHEMLLKHGDDSRTTTPFVVTGSPLDNTSDNLVSPFQLTPEGVQSNLQKIEQWICEVFRGGTVKRVMLFLTEGYDDQFERLEISPSEVRSLLSSKIEAVGDVPSLVVDVVP